jgi:hypothetical protein
MSMIPRLFVDHPASVNETHWQHRSSAMRFGSTMVIAGRVCTRHGLLPVASATRGREAVGSLYQRMVTERVGRRDPARVE